MKAGHFLNDDKGRPKAIDREVHIDVKLNAFTIDVIKDVIEHLIDEYGTENFMILAKEVMEQKRGPKQGLEVWITMLSAIVVMFEHQAQEQGKVRELDDDEMEIFKRKMQEYDDKYGKDKPTGN
jgi:hypothetical protein